MNLLYNASLAFSLVMFSAGAVHAECKSYKTPSILDKNSFLARKYGTLSFSPNKYNRFLSFDSIGCYDISKWKSDGKLDI